MACVKWNRTELIFLNILEHPAGSYTGCENSNYVAGYSLFNMKNHGVNSFKEKDDIEFVTRQ